MGEIFYFAPATIVELFRAGLVVLFLVSISLKYTFFVGAFLAAFAGLLQLFSSRFIHPFAERILGATTSYTSAFAEVIAGIKQIKIFENLSFFQKRFSAAVYTERASYTKSLILREIPPRLISALGVSFILGAVIYARLYHLESFGEIIPVILTYLIALQRMLPSLGKVSANWMSLRDLVPRLASVKAILTEAPKADSSAGEPFPGIFRSIEFRKLDFAYGHGAPLVLSGVDFTVPALKTTAIVGPSGAGKSTLVDLLVGLFEPTGGTIAVDGVDVSRYSLASWRARLSVLSQDPFIFHCSVLENIQLGRPEASMDEIVAASKTANAHEFIMGLPQGYDTVLGDRGVKISGGQKQRIALARALVRKPELLIMDEATSALDNLSEKVFQENLRLVSGKTTVLMIAHRLSTVRHADQIVVIEKGRVVERGSHDELVRKGAAYFRMLNSDLGQAAGEA